MRMFVVWECSLFEIFVLSGFLLYRDFCYIGIFAISGFCYIGIFVILKLNHLRFWLHRRFTAWMFEKQIHWYFEWLKIFLYFFVGYNIWDGLFIGYYNNWNRFNKNKNASFFSVAFVWFVGPWYNGPWRGMRIPRPGFKSQRVPNTHVMLTLGKSTYHWISSKKSS